MTDCREDRRGREWKNAGRGLTSKAAAVKTARVSPPPCPVAAPAAAVGDEQIVIFVERLNDILRPGVCVVCKYSCRLSNRFSLLGMGINIRQLF